MVSNPSAKNVAHFLDQEKDSPLIADTELLSQVLLDVLEEQTSPIVAETIHQLIEGSDAELTIKKPYPHSTAAKSKI